LWGKACIAFETVKSIVNFPDFSGLDLGQKCEKNFGERKAVEKSGVKIRRERG
jgi:hypothetical protein